jgi:hypothetical protein
MVSDLKILVCMHTPYKFPKEDIYLPIQVGKAISNYDLDIQGDNTGDNISEKNKSFCELSALYWAWKNIKTLYPELKYVGLCHYRRYLSFDKTNKNYSMINVPDIPDMYSYNDIIHHYLQKYQIILPKRCIYPYNISIDYSIAHHSDDYRTIKQIVHELYPEYDDSFLFICEHNNKASLCNIFITHYSYFVNYCEWLFKILFEAEKRINITNYTDVQKRVFGYLAERLLNVYVFHNKLKALYNPIYFLNKPERMNAFHNFKTNIRRECSFALQESLRARLLGKYSW